MLVVGDFDTVKRFTVSKSNAERSATILLKNVRLALNDTFKEDGVRSAASPTSQTGD